MNELYHHGIKGQKWGVRRYQNEDGTYTEEGKARRNSHKEHRIAFISGSSKTQDKESGYYRRGLNKDIKDYVDDLVKSNATILVGDAPGIDRQVQNYLKKLRYDSVKVYGPGDKVRYSANKDWETRPIDAPEFEKGSKEWLAKKDIEMGKAATEGLAIILDEGASATRKNISRMEEQGKPMDVYSLNRKSSDSWVKRRTK